METLRFEECLLYDFSHPGDGDIIGDIIVQNLLISA